jgi:2'-5' RNA ligase
MDGPVVTVDGSSSGDRTSSEGSGGAIDLFALVVYLPDPLSSFLSHLRHDLDPRFQGRPHLTILPPRPLPSSWEQAWSELKVAIHSSQPVEVELGEVEMFQQSQVVYLSLREGYTEIQNLHQRLNEGCARCGEAWPYHPHITLGHGFFGGSFAEAARSAQQRWNTYSGARKFTIGRLTWVKTTIIPGVSERGTRSLVASDSVWIDLADSELSAKAGS